MTIETPDFQGTHLWNRLHWAKENLEGVQTDYRVVWEDPKEPDAPGDARVRVAALPLASLIVPLLSRSAFVLE